MGQKLNQFQPQSLTHILGIQGCTLPGIRRDVLRMRVTQRSHPLPELTPKCLTSQQALWAGKKPRDGICLKPNSCKIHRVSYGLKLFPVLMAGTR